jgi:DNA repair exonuclease SbcCD ATPase subunit
MNDRELGFDGSPQPRSTENPKTKWGLLGVGLAVGFLGMNLFVTRPLTARIAKLEVELSTVEEGMQDLVGVRNEVWQTSNLLNSLKAQRQQVADANAALKEMREFRQEFMTESAQTAAASQSLEGLIALQNSVLAQQNAVVPAAEMLQESLQQLIAVKDLAQAQAPELPQAVTTLKELIALKDQARTQAGEISTAQSSLKELISLKDQAFAQFDTLAASKTSLQGLVDLKARVIDYTSDLTQAGEAVGGLLALKDQVVGQGEAAVQAQARTNELLALRDKLLVPTDSLTTADANLTNLIAMKDKVVGQSEDVAAAIQTLEILSDFSEEFESRIASLGQLRQSLMEIVLLETTITRVTRALEPMTQLGNIRRLNDGDLRDAARTILEQRQTRVTQKPEQPMVQTESAPGVVPTPVDLPE